MADTWGGSWAGSWAQHWFRTITPPVVTQTFTGMGPGWNLFQALPERKRKVDTLEAEIRALLEKAEDADTPKEKREVVKEIRAKAREIVAEAPRFESDVPLHLLADALKALQGIEMSMLAYLDSVRKAVEQKRLQDEDDMEAVMLIARLT